MLSLLVHAVVGNGVFFYVTMASIVAVLLARHELVWTLHGAGKNPTL